MLRMQVKLVGASELAARLKKVGVDLYDLHTEMILVGEMLKKFYSSENFTTRGSLLGKPWAPLAASTRADKNAHWAGKPDLVRTGDLMKGFQFAAGRMQVAVNNKVTVEGKGQTYNLATLMQKGTSRGMPPRAMMGFTEVLRRDIVAVVDRGVKEKLVGL